MTVGGRSLLCSLIVLFFSVWTESVPEGNESATKEGILLETKDAGRGEGAGPLKNSKTITIFMAGDVMTGRGIDQVLPHPNDPLIHEPYLRSAKGYVDLAETANGAIKRPVSFPYIWGDALKELNRLAPDVRIINLETSVTGSDDYWRGKGIHYRMHPDNMPAITSARIDAAALANNHVLDWGYSGLSETLKSLKMANLKYSGAGENLSEAEAPAVIKVEGKGRVILFSYGLGTSGISSEWPALEDRPGVNLLQDLSDGTVRHIREKVRGVRREGDIVVVSIHWGGNWGYDIPEEQTEFARKLIDKAGVDVVHGHSSHHAKGIEVYRDRPIIYGAGDFINDYEGIRGYEEYRDDLALMYFATLDPSTGRMVSLRMTPMQIRNFRLNRASAKDAKWLRDVLNREGEKFNTSVELNDDNTLTLQWK